MAWRGIKRQHQAYGASMLRSAGCASIWQRWRKCKHENSAGGMSASGGNGVSSSHLNSHHHQQHGDIAQQQHGVMAANWRVSTT